ncbi:MAG: acyl-ACP--UDP-N-acetylglucosamine O-acyltransferase [Betaproteobacteria bacterium]|nr:acyl-ACP--UDP-N-acetylglucosamine O-acyltransferase [Betaproteobacteria bacterium]NCA16552.1 acyl-ACP--UDP-N-acetylglucosamine O-acyltransferase [Betaproteobacteria bacterium]
MATIHSTALVDSGAQLHSSVEIGAFCIVGPHVKLGEGCRLMPFAQVIGHTTLGAENVIHSHAVIGNIPQDKKYAQEQTRLEIGDRNTFRECCTVNIGTAQDAGVTRIGSDNWIMAYVHIAHDCSVGSHVIMANSVQLAGHVKVGDWAILGGITGVHQFVRIGAHAMTGAGTTLIQDLPPYVMATGNPAAAHGVNSEGLRRRGFSEEQIATLRRAYKTVYKTGLTLAEALTRIAEEETSTDCAAALQPFTEFLAAPGRGIVR